MYCIQGFLIQIWYLFSQMLFWLYAQKFPLAHSEMSRERERCDFRLMPMDLKFDVQQADIGMMVRWFDYIVYVHA